MGSVRNLIGGLNGALGYMFWSVSGKKQPRVLAYAESATELAGLLKALLLQGLGLHERLAMGPKSPASVPFQQKVAGKGVKHANGHLFDP